MSAVIGWDIGGAHLKAARAEDGRIVAATQIPSPLRLGIDSVSQAITQAKAALGPADRHVVTMTGELADTFPSRRDGVDQLVTSAMTELDGAPVMLYAGRAGFIRPEP